MTLQLTDSGNHSLAASGLDQAGNAATITSPVWGLDGNPLTPGTPFTGEFFEILVTADGLAATIIPKALGTSTVTINAKAGDGTALSLSESVTIIPGAATAISLIAVT